MSDNSRANSGSGGDLFATDEVTIGGTSVKVPRGKLGYGADGTYAGDVATDNPFPVQVRSSAGTELGVAAAPMQVSLANHAANATAVKVDGSAVTQPVSAASLPLPSGAATAAKQPALGTAGTASADVLTVQGIASGVAIDVADGGGSLTVDGTVTATLSSSTNAGATAKTLDYDTGAGTDTVTAFGILLPASGGSVAGGTASAPLRVDPTGTTAQPVTDGGSSLTVDGTVSISGNVATTSGVGSQADGHSETLGATSDADTASTVIGRLKKLVALLAGGLPAALGANGGLKVEGISGGVQVPVSDGAGSLTVDAPVGTPVFVRLSDGSSAISTLPVSLASVPSHAVTNAGTFAVQESGAALTALQLIDDTVYSDDATFTPGTSKVIGVGLQADEVSTDSVDEGDVGMPRMTLDRKVIVTPQPHTKGGLSVFRSLDLDETDEDVKTSAGCLYKLRITNRATSTRYIKLYNATAANVTVGTTTPIDTIPVPGNASDHTVLTENFGGLGLEFDTALSIAATTGFADNDTGAPGANDVIVSAYYK